MPVDIDAVNAAAESSPAEASDWVSLGRGCLQLYRLSFRRQLFSRQTLVCCGLLLLLAALVVAWSLRAQNTPKRFAEQVLMTTYIGFLLPILALSYGASCVGSEREDRTLIYLLIVPIPRPLVLLTKAAASLSLVWLGTIGSLLLLCGLAGQPGREVWPIFLTGSLLGATAYTTLFLLIGTIFRHGTMISLAYWFFLEVLFGALPGLMKRITVSFYIKSQLYDAGSDIPLRPLGRVAREMFLAVSGDVAITVLIFASALFLGLGAYAFHRHQFPELG